MKFIPEITSDKFWGILTSHPDASNQEAPIGFALHHMRSCVDKEIFAYEKPYTQLNFPESGGITGYFSRNMTQGDLDLTKRFLKTEQCVSKGLDILNTRVFKRAENDYILTVASVSDQESCTVELEGSSFELRFGEFSDYLHECNYNLTKAL